MLSFNLSLPVIREATKDECRTPADCYRVVREIDTMPQECFVVLTLNTKHRVIDRHLISFGILDACLVHPREVFRPAIADGAAAIVVCHNHPSGDPQPSAEDIRITRQIIEAGRLLNIDVLDHVVIGRPDDRNPQGYISLRESGLVNFINN